MPLPTGVGSGGFLPDFFAQPLLSPFERNERVPNGDARLTLELKEFLNLEAAGPERPDHVAMAEVEFQRLISWPIKPGACRSKTAAAAWWPTDHRRLRRAALNPALRIAPDTDAVPRDRRVETRTANAAFSALAVVSSGVCSF
jgi:hypothetical protein